MKISVQSPVAIFIVASLLIIGSLSLIPFAQADGSSPEKVPAPWVTESHFYNRPDSNGNNTQGNYNNEAWGITITHGDIKTGLSARNYSNGNRVCVDYGQNTMFYIGGKFYIAMFTIDQVLIMVGNDTLVTPLRNCAGFELTYTKVKYDGTIPTMECNITYKKIRVYSDAPDSTFDLTLLNHFRGDWNQTSIKVEALLDFSNMNLGQHIAGEHFTAEIHYIMQLTDPNMVNQSPPDFNTVKPSEYTDTSLKYNMTRDDGSPYTLSRLEMNDNFTINNASGSRSAVGYSRIDSPNMTSGNGQTYNHNSRVVTHGFPNLTYEDTISMKSDPEITVFHDRVTANSNPSISLIPIVGVGAILAAAGIGAVLFIRKRKRDGKERNGEKNQMKP
jgi:hypothetical protein